MTRLLDRFQVEVIEVYAAEKASSLKPEVRRAFKRGEVFTVTVYSARAAEALAAAVDRAGVGAEARKASALCLSPRITARLQSRGWREARSVSPPDTSGISAQLLGVRGPFLEESRNRGAAIPSTVQKSEPSAVPSPMEPSMTTPTPPPARSGPGWPAFIILAIVAIAGGAWLWYMAQERQAELTAQLSGIRQELAAIEADPGREERAALAERTAELEETGAGADFETLNELIAEARALSESVAEAEQLARQTAATNTEALAGLTGQTRELTVTVSDMQERLNTLASKQEERFSALAERLDTAQEELATAKEALQERSQRLQETQAAVGELRSMIDSLESWAEDMQPARLAERLIALGDLRRVVNAGAPFSAALERAAKAIPAVKEAEGDWLDWADNGIPTEEELTRRLAQIEKDLPPPATADADGGVVDRALGVLLGGIQIEGKGTLVDDPVRSAIVEAQEAMKQDDHAAAKAALAPVADDVEPVAEWLKALSARTSAEAAIQHWENTVLAEVGESVQ